MTTYDLIDILPNTLSNQFDFTAVYGDDSFYIFSTEFFVSEIYQHFASRKIRLADNNPTENLIALFNIWKSYRNDTYARRAYALDIDYNPLENYDSTETKEGKDTLTRGTQDQRTHADTDTRTNENTDTRTHADTDMRTHENTDTRTHNDTITTTFNNTDTTNHTGTDTTDRNVYGVNSAEASNADRDTVTHDTTDETTHGGDQDDAHKGTITDAHTGTITDAHTGTITDAHTGTIKDAHTGTITDAHTGTDTTATEYILKRHGNIGVTTSQQMLESDLALLKYDLSLIAVCDFIDRYTIYTGGIDL